LSQRDVFGRFATDSGTIVPDRIFINLFSGAIALAMAEIYTGHNA
jgi:hypothetical protein